MGPLFPGVLYDEPQAEMIDANTKVNIEELILFTLFDSH